MFDCLFAAESFYRWFACLVEPVCWTFLTLCFSYYYQYYYDCFIPLVGVFRGRKYC